MEKRKQNAKKVTVIAAVILMFSLVIGMGAFTYAKYVSTQETGNQNATAAKWGIVISADASSMFGTDYTKGDGANANATVVAGGAGVAVKATSTAKIVAPGTEGSLTVTVNGTAEVLSKLTFESTADWTDISVKENDTVYNPIKWTLKKGDTAVTGAENVTLVVLKDKLLALTEKYDAGTSISQKYTISWVWAFEQNNGADTAIGYKSANTIESLAKIDTKYTDFSTTISLAFTVKVEQIQTKD